MHGGVLQQYDTPAAIYETPANVFVAGFMGSPNMNFFRGRAVAHGDGFGVVLDGGDERVLPVPGDRTAGLSDGRPVIFGVRPEHFSPASARRAARKGHPSVMVPARVEMDEPTGAETILMCRIAGRRPSSSASRTRPRARATR